MGVTHPVERLPAIIHRNGKLELGRQPVVHVEYHSANFMRDPFTKIEICLQAPKHPTSAVEIHIHRPSSVPGSELFGIGLEDPDCDLAARDWAFLLRDFEVALRDESTAVGGKIGIRVRAEIGDGNLVRGMAAGGVLLIVFDVVGLEVRDEMGGDAVDERVEDGF